MAVCAAYTLVRLPDFPIYFFTDEAAQTVLADEFLQNGLRDASGELFPTYFLNTENLNLGLSVYAQVVTVLLFGRSIWATRATAALLALSGTVAIAVILRVGFRLRRAWLGPLFLAVTPAWFLHSRTAFETGLYADMFAWFLAAYLMYRSGRPGWLPAAVLFAGLAFYSYNAGQPGLLLAGLLLLAADARHLGRLPRRLLLPALLLLVLLSLPYLRFLTDHPGESRQRLGLLDSYLVRPDLAPLEKAARLLGEYARGLNPAYWYAPDNGVDLIRHRMKGYGNILWPTLPLAAVGLAACLRRFRDPAHRAVLVALLTAPAGAALVGVQVTRVLVLVVPAAVLTALGAAALLDWAGRRLGEVRTSLAAFALLACAGGWMLRDALVNGPTWYSDYGLDGLQYGAPQVFEAAGGYLDRHPGRPVWVFPSWINGPDMLRRFFVPDEPSLQLLELEPFLGEWSDGLEDALLILTRQDYQRALDSEMVVLAGTESVLPLPDGTPGFYLVRMDYSSQGEAIFAAQREARGRMVTEEIRLEGRAVMTRHSPFAAGILLDLFDGNPATQVLTAGANPLRIELDFGAPLPITGLALTAEMDDLRLTFRGFAPGLRPAYYATEFRGRADERSQEILFDPPPGRLSRVVIELLDLNQPPDGSVGLGELALREAD
ncbi:MAG TPA: glycosyltransferase family 39 protein [Anaerolineales bacterium]|nr:glycosyltransferase family 39 protein [Anaerolineales bacterium]